MGEILDGKRIAQEIRKEVAHEVEELKARGQKLPHLAVIMVGNNPASETYVNNKMKACNSVGFDSTLYKFSVNISEEKLLREIQRLNEDEDVDGFIVQLPLPDHIQKYKVIDTILPEKDVDGFTNENYGKITAEKTGLLPATPYGIMVLLERYNIDTRGKNAVVVGQSRTVGSPVSSLLVHQGQATVTCCHINTQDLKKHTSEADLVIVAVGKPGLITASMIKEGAVVVDVGINRIQDESTKSGFKLIGDVDYNDVKDKASFITPVPGGVGPMTIASLLMNTLTAYKKRLSTEKVL